MFTSIFMEIEMLKSKRLIKKLEKMSFHAVIPLSLGSNLP